LPIANPSLSLQVRLCVCVCVCVCWCICSCNDFNCVLNFLFHGRADIFRPSQPASSSSQLGHQNKAPSASLPPLPSHPSTFFVLQRLRASFGWLRPLLAAWSCCRPLPLPPPTSLPAFATWTSIELGF